MISVLLLIRSTPDSPLAISWNLKYPIQQRCFKMSECNAMHSILYDTYRYTHHLFIRKVKKKEVKHLPDLLLFLILSTIIQNQFR